MANLLQRALAMFRVRASGDAITGPHELYQYLLGRGHESDSGALVTADRAMRTSTVYSCVKLLSEDIAKLPLHMYERLDRGKARVTKHWLVELLDQPNPWQTDFEFREMQQSHTELVGEFIALKTVVRGETRELLPLPPHRIQRVEQLPNYRLIYHLSMPNGEVMAAPMERVYHVRGLSVDGIRGMSPIDFQREAVGLNIQLTKYGAKLFKNGALIGGMLEHPGPAPMSDLAYKRLKESFDEQYTGITSAHKTVLLEEGTKYHAVAMKAQEAQYLESRKFSRSEIAGLYRIPPHMLGDLDRATFSNIEHLAIEYVQNALLPRLRRLEPRMAMSLLSREERRKYYVHHVVDGLLRGDYATRMAGYVNAINNSIMTPNEVRELEDRNPGPPEMDKFRMPLNMQFTDDPRPNRALVPPRTGTPPAPQENDTDA
jgi:HK97 family phage portal protein